MVLPSISVVVPALNEARNIPHVSARMPSDVHEIILVDGFSTDDTVAVARQLRPEVRVVRQSRMGKGNAVACGIAVATGEFIAMVDADGSQILVRSRGSWRHCSTAQTSLGNQIRRRWRQC